MKWFRSNINRVSRLALFALAVQFALSFGHFHGIPAASIVQSASAQSESRVAGDPIQTAENLATPQGAPDQGSPEHPGDICAICVVMAMTNAALFATPPVVLLPQAVEFAYQPPDVELVRVNAVRAGFQPRAPPIC